MGTVAEVEELQREIRRRVSNAKISVDPPDDADGSWWVDVERDGNIASVAWRPSEGFGVAAPGGSYGEGPDHIVTDPSSAAAYIARILDRRGERVREDELQEHVDSILRSMEIAKEHYDQVMRAIAAQMGIQLPPTLRTEMTIVADEVRQIELEVLEMAKSLLTPRSSSTRTADDTEN